jgi:endonuclease YncB( thermonuclease family)
VSRIRPLWRTAYDAVKFLGVLVIVLLVLRHFDVLDVMPGNVRVIDGDSLRRGQTEIRLHGIDAPEYRQTCRDAVRAEYSCGKRAAEELRSLVRGVEIKCQSLETDRYGRAVATCHAGTVNINREMVARGWAVALMRFGSEYMLAEKQARAARRGLWAGSFEEPSLYRQRMRTARGDMAGQADEMTPD